MEDLKKEISLGAISVAVPVICEYAAKFAKNTEAKLFDEYKTDLFKRSMILADNKECVCLRAIVVDIKEYKFPDLQDNKKMIDAVNFIYFAINKLWSTIINSCYDEDVKKQLSHKLNLDADTSTLYLTKGDRFHIGIILTRVPRSEEPNSQ